MTDIRSYFPTESPEKVGKRRWEGKELGDDELVSMPDKRVKIGDAAAGKAHKQVGDSRYAEYLAGLSYEDARALHRVFRNKVGVIIKSHLPADLQARLRVFENRVDPTRLGRWYLDHLSCELVRSSSTAICHPRWQVRLDGGPSSVAGALRVALSDGAWQALSRLTNYAKIMAHHIAYNADSRRVAAPIPLNVGAGGSISHLCDEVGCVKQSHLESTPVHRDNMDRQRCRGILLLVFRDVIVEETPCSHGRGRGGSLALDILASCTKVVVEEVSMERPSAPCKSL